MKLTLSKVALTAFVATTAFTATSANAAQYRTYGCEFAFFEGCGRLIEQAPSQGGGRRVVRLTHDTSPTYMKQIDPRYSSAMRDAGGGGGGGGGGSGGR